MPTGQWKYKRKAVAMATQFAERALTMNARSDMLRMYWHIWACVATYYSYSVQAVCLHAMDACEDERVNEPTGALMSTLMNELLQ